MKHMLVLAVMTVAQCAAQNTMDVVVVNKGAAVKDLTPKDFKLSLDGKDQPVTGAVMGDKNRKQLYTMIFDLSTLKSGDQIDIRKYLQSFLDANVRPDRMFNVIAFGGSLRQIQGFTSDPELLKTAVTSILTGTPSAPSDSRNYTSAVGALAQNLAKLPGRKSIMMFTNGQLPTAVGTSAGAQIERETPTSGGNSSAGGLEIDKTAMVLNAADIGFHTISPNSSAERNFTNATDGMFIKVSTDLADALVKITNEQDATYTLTYTPSGNLKPGCHKVALKVSGGGNSVKARDTFCDLP